MLVSGLPLGRGALDRTWRCQWCNRVRPGLRCHDDRNISILGDSISVRQVRTGGPDMFSDAPSCLTESSGRVSAHACPVQNVTLRSPGVCHEWRQGARPHFGVVVPSLIMVDFWGPAQVSHGRHRDSSRFSVSGVHLIPWPHWTYHTPQSAGLAELRKRVDHKSR